MLKRDLADNCAIVARLQFCSMQPPDLMQWVRHLRAVAEPVARLGSPRGAGPIDAMLEAAVWGTQVDAKPSPRGGPEVRLWAALVDPRIDPPEIDADEFGPLFAQGLYRTIEVWTESELCGLHALWNLAQLRRGEADPSLGIRAGWFRRVETAREWHMANTQPDNATNRPWALHVFLLSGSKEGRHYAQTLLHNCLAINGRPDPLSAWILLDAANAIERGTRA
jgi:hypothetical protein